MIVCRYKELVPWRKKLGNTWVNGLMDKCMVLANTSFSMVITILGNGIPN
jgi:hypothetical protein